MLRSVHTLVLHFYGGTANTERSDPSAQGAPESVLERCSYVRVSGSARVPLSPVVREQLLSVVREWATGRDTLRCLAMATRDAPPDIHRLNLENSAAFANYEVRAGPC